MLLMFGVGLHFSLGDLLAVRKIALPGAIVQITVATLLGGGTALTWGWSVGAALVFRLALSVASTVVLLRALEGRGLVETVNGRIAVGWLVVEDLVMVLVLVLLPPVAGLLGGTPPGDAQAAGGSVWGTLGVTMLKVAAFIALMLVVGKRVFPRILWLVARTGSRELFTLCMIAAAVGIAFGAAKLFDVSFALGAFFAGMMMRESEFSRRAADDAAAARCVLGAVLHFGRDAVRPEDPARGAAARDRGRGDRGDRQDARGSRARDRVPLSAEYRADGRRGAAQIGEFSFILAETRPCARAAVGRGAEPDSGRRADLDRDEHAAVRDDRSGARVDPQAFGVRAQARGPRRSARRAADVDAADAPDRAGRDRRLRQGRYPNCARAGRARHRVCRRRAESRLVEKLREDGVAAVSGDAIEPIVLVQAHIARAGMLVVTLPDVFDVRQIVEISRT